MTVGGTPFPQPSLKLEERLVQVAFTQATDNTPEFVTFDEPLTLPMLGATQVYVIAQGSTGSGSGCHFRSTALDVENLLQGSPIIADWFPNVNAKYNFGGSEPSGGWPTVASVAEAGSGTPKVLDSVATSNQVLVGFRYLTDVGPASFAAAATSAVQQFGTTDVQLSAELADSGVPVGAVEGAETTLYFEVANNSEFTGSTLLLATPPDVTGAQTNLPFNRTLTGLNADDERWFRPVAINEAGRVQGTAQRFVVGSMDVGVSVSRTIASDGGTGDVRPSSRLVVSGESTTFLALPAAGSDVVATTTCSGGLSRSGNTFTVGPVTATCEIAFTFVEAQEPAAVSPVEESVAVAVRSASELSGTDGVVVRRNVPVPLVSTTVPTVGPRGGLVLEDDEGELKVTISTAAGVSPTAGVVVPTDGEIVCEVCARLAAGSVAEAWVLSDPRLAAAVRVEVDDEDEEGCPLLRIPVGTPLDGGGAIEAGAHTLQLRMHTEDGFEVLAVPITIGGIVPTSVPSGEGPGTLRGSLDLLLAGLALAALGAVATRRRTRTTGTI